jgi:hypothetical protein
LDVVFAALFLTFASVALVETSHRAATACVKFVCGDGEDVTDMPDDGATRPAVALEKPDVPPPIRADAEDDEPPAYRDVV